MSTHWRIAHSKWDLDAAQRLRFASFRDECGIDVPFDPRVGREISSRDALASAHIVLVWDGGDAVATARLAQADAEVAKASGTRWGFEFEEEFSLDSLELSHRAVGEVARLCVRRSHLGTDAAICLYEGLVSQSRQLGIRYWLGAVDCRTAHEDEARLMHRVLARRGILSSALRAVPRTRATAQDASRTEAAGTRFYKHEELERAERGEFDSINVSVPIASFVRRLGAKCIGLPARHPAFPRFVAPMTVEVDAIPVSTTKRFREPFAPAQRRASPAHTGT